MWAALVSGGRVRWFVGSASWVSGACVSGPFLLQTFPSLDTIATRISDALEMMNIRRCTGIGVGAGANILLRIARDNPIVLNGV